MDLPPFRRRIVRRLLARGGPWAVAFALASPATALADAIAVEDVSDAEVGYAPVAELSHEVIVTPSGRGGAKVAYRLALNNASAVPRDAVVTWGLPAGARITALAVMRDGRWRPGKVVRDVDAHDARDPGSVFVRRVQAGGGGVEAPAAELVVFQMPPEMTIQVEIETQVPAALRGGRYEIRLPERGKPVPGVASRRRLLVRGVERFWVDDTPNGGAPVVEVEARRENVVAWPATDARRTGLSTKATYADDGFGGADVELVLEIGRGTSRTPDLVYVLLDRSVSTDRLLPDKALSALSALLAELPEHTHLAFAVFAREVVPLDAPKGLEVGDFDMLRDAWRAVILSQPRRPGTDVYGALEAALDDARARGARRPLVLLVGDGMYPSSPPPRHLLERLRRADLLLLVDVPAEYEPPGPRHPVVAFAHATGGRLAALPLASITEREAAAVLASPRVARIRSVSARGVHFDPAPAYVPTGHRVVVRGRATSPRPPAIRIVAETGRRTVRRNVRPRPVPRAADAFGVHLFMDEGTDVRSGFALPVWYDEGTRRAVVAEVRRARLGVGAQEGSLTEAIVRGYLRMRVLPRVRVCHRHAVARHRDQGGRAVLAFEIARGEVMGVALEDVELAHDDAKLERCLLEAGWALDVPAARRDDRVYVVRYPVRLLPADDQPARISAEDEATLHDLLGDAPRHRPKRRAPTDDPLRLDPLPR